MKKSQRLGIALLAVAIVGALSGCTVPTSSPPPPKPGNVAVLVVDDFGFGKSGEVGGMNDNCAVATNDVGSGGAGDDLPASDYSHGELVYSVLKDELIRLNPGATPTSLTTPRPSSSAPPVETSTDWTYKVEDKPYTVRLVAVHAGNYRTEDVIAGISERIRSLHAGEDGGVKFDYFVLNLSFVVIPCNVAMWLDQEGLTGLLASYKLLSDKDETLRKALDSYTNDGAPVDAGVAQSDAFNAGVLRDDRFAQLRPFVVGAFYDHVQRKGESFKEGPIGPVNNDPAWSAFRREPLGKPDPENAKLVVNTVGAAGNGVKLFNKDGSEIRRGLPFPFAPALWDFVVSASADASTDLYNSGEVKLDFKGPIIQQSPIQIRAVGSSFSAPRLSAKEAIYLLKTGYAACDSHTPPLGYVGVASGAPNAVSAGGTWENRAEIDWPAKCQKFVSLTAPV